MPLLEIMMGVGFLLVVLGFGISEYFWAIHTPHVFDALGILMVLCAIFVLAFLVIIISFFAFAQTFSETDDNCHYSSRLFVISQFIFLLCSILGFKYAKGRHLPTVLHDFITFWHFHLGGIELSIVAIYCLFFSRAWSRNGPQGLSKFLVAVVMFPMLFPMSMFSRGESR